MSRPMSSSTEMANVLSVFMDEHHVGSLYNETPLAFAYDPMWLNGALAKPLAPEIPLRAEKVNSPYVHAFFENLLPEGEQRKLISMRHHVSTLFGLLATVGGDTAGSVVLLPSGQLPQPPRYRSLEWNQLNQLIHGEGFNDKKLREIIREQTNSTKSGITLSGVQHKLLISLDQHGLPLLPLGPSPTTHILKPDIIRNDIALFSSAVNETIVMRLAQLCELPTADVSYQPEVKACLIKRYDRLQQADGQLRRLWQADFCQLLGKPSDVKYEMDGGPSFKECFDLLLTYSVRPAIDQRNLLRWLFFNLYVGNNDSHAKNLSILGKTEGLRLAPFYDLMSTRVYSGLAQQFTFQIGGEFSPGKMQHSHLESFARLLGVKTNYLMKIASEMAEQVENTIPVATHEIASALAPAEKVMAERIEQKIGGIVKKMRSRFL